MIPLPDGLSYAGILQPYAKGDLLETVTSNFSTSGPCEVAASHISLMAASKHYFTYFRLTKCGIPQVSEVAWNT